MSKTKQELLWSGSFGDSYTLRNQSISVLTSSIALFRRILGSTRGVKSVIEFGANVGINLKAIRLLLPNAELSALEINAKAVKKLKEIETLKVYQKSIVEFKPDFKRDFVFTRGLLIHLNPELLPKAYDVIFESSKKYICLAEYYNPTPIEVNYRDHAGSLFKRDFAGEMLNRYKKLKLVDYGFVYHNDNYFPQDDINWFLLEICQ